MFSFLKCIGLNSDGMSAYTHEQLAQEEARIKQERADAKEVIQRSVKKASRKGVGFFYTRDVYVTEDESALAYAKANANAVEKTLPFAQMNAPVAKGQLVTISMRNQAEATAMYKFQLTTDDEATAWAEALTKFLPEGAVPGAAEAEGHSLTHAAVEDAPEEPLPAEAKGATPEGEVAPETAAAAA